MGKHHIDIQWNLSPKKEGTSDPCYNMIEIWAIILHAHCIASAPTRREVLLHILLYPRSAWWSLLCRKVTVCLGSTFWTTVHVTSTAQPAPLLGLHHPWITQHDIRSRHQHWHGHHTDEKDNKRDETCCARGVQPTLVALNIEVKGQRAKECRQPQKGNDEQPSVHSQGESGDCSPTKAWTWIPPTIQILLARSTLFRWPLIHMNRVLLTLILAQADFWLAEM